MAGPPAARRIRVARIGAPHGVRGEVRLQSYTADPLALAGYGPLESEDGQQRFGIEALRPAKGHLVARLSGVTDRNRAEQLTNIDLYVPRERLPPPADDEFYHADLIGLTAVDRSGVIRGSVIAVHNFGAGDLLEIAPPAGPTVMMPFNAGTAPEIDIAGGRIVIDPPDGVFPEAGSAEDRS